MPDDSTADQPPVGTDLAATVAQLRSDVRELQAEVRLLKGHLLQLNGHAAARQRAGAPADAGADPTARPARPATESRERPASAGWHERRGPFLGRRHGDVESLVGRYGTIGLGALLLLMAAGVLLNWAVQRIQFGPTARVALGAAGAAVVAGVGWRLRRRGSRAFGNTLLGIALALVHVDAWGAGPSLGVVPDGVALGFAAVASAVLALLAWRAGEESLFVVGVGGAFLAPFVTASKRDDVVLLLLYGWVVMAAAVFALRGRDWRVAARVLAIAIAAYTAIAVLGDWSGATRAVRDAPTTFTLACAAVLLVVGTGALSGWLTRVCLWTSAAALAAGSFGPEHLGDVPVLAAIATAIAYLTARGSTDDEIASWRPTVIGVPLALLAIVLTKPEWGLTPAHAWLAAAWSAAALVAARDSARLRGAHLLVAGVASAYAVVAATHSSGVSATMFPVAAIAALAVDAALFGAFARRAPDPLRLVAPMAALLVASFWAQSLLHARPAFVYTPFLTRASFGALVVVVGWIVVTLHARAMRPAESTIGVPPAAVLGGIAAIAAFLWGREELVRAVSVEVAIFLVILYFAAAGVTSILAGRRFALSAARRAGLAVAVYAALKALYQAADLENVALRIGAYVLVGSFLLAVAFWYRSAGDDDVDLVTPDSPIDATLQA